MLYQKSSRFVRHRRRGSLATTLLAALFLIAAAGGVGYWLYTRQAPEQEIGPLLQSVLRGPYSNIVLEQGEVESGSNVEIRCEVKARTGGSGISILSVVPEGTLVEEGDLICKLDSTALELEMVQQQITVNSSEALVVQARNTHEAAIIAKVEYLEGTFKQEERMILGEVFVAEQNLRSGQLAYESAERLASKNIITSLQLEGAQFAVEKARNELLSAQGKLDVLRKYTKEKMLKTLESDIATSLANFKSVQSSYELELSKLNDISTQVEKCTILAPAAGQVVYVNKYSGGRTTQAEFVVEAGATVREQQPLFRLPDGKNMQVKALVNESRVTLVRVGMPVSIRVDALKDQTMSGEVVKVNQYAEPGGWGSSTIKKYATIIKILDPPPNLRVNMNAEVRIYVERRPEALQIPVQALAEYKGRYFTIVKNGSQYDTKEIKVASTNDQSAVIESGLMETDQVVLNPRSYTNLLKLPEIKDSAPMNIGSAPSTTPVPTSLTGGPGGGPGGSASPENGPPGGGPPGGARNPSAIFERYDTDGDGKLSISEIQAIEPEPFRSRLQAGDTNQDGFVDRSELAAMPRPSGGRGAPGGPGVGGGSGGEGQ